MRLLSKFRINESYTWQSAISVEMFFLKPYCLSVSMLWQLKNDSNWDSIHFSKSLEKGEVRQMGLWFPHLCFSPFLKIGITQPYFISSGYTPCCIHKLSICVNTGAITVQAIFKNLIGGSDGLTLFVASIFLMWFKTSWTVIGFNLNESFGEKRLGCMLSWVGNELASFSPMPTKYLLKILEILTGSETSTPFVSSIIRISAPLFCFKFTSILHFT